MTSSPMAPRRGHGSGPPQVTGALTGALVGAVFGLVFVEANSGELPRTWQTVARVGGAVVFVLLLIGIRRAHGADEAGEPASGTAFGRGYWLIVAAEAAALVGGLIVINVVIGAHELAVAWIALVVGVHFFGLGILWKAGVFHVLGTMLTVLGIAGFALHAAGRRSSPGWAPDRDGPVSVRVRPSSLMGIWQATATRHKAVGAPGADRGACLSGSMPPSSPVRDALLETGRIWRVQVVPVTPGGARGLDPWCEIGAPAPTAGSSATRRAACPETAVRGGMGGRGPSHPQEQPLYQHPEPPSPGEDRGLRAAGVTNG